MSTICLMIRMWDLITGIWKTWVEEHQLGSIANWDKVCFLYILKARFLSLHSQLVSDSSLVEYTFNNLYKFEISDEILTIYVIVRTETVSKLTFVDLKI